MSDKQGLNSSDALRKMIAEVEILVKEHESPPRLEDIQRACLLPPTLLWPFLLLSLSCAMVLIASPSPFGNSQVCGLLLLFILFLNTLFAVQEAKKKKRELVKQLQCFISHLSDVVENSFRHDCLELHSFEKLLQACDTAALLNSPSHSISKVYRTETDSEVIRPIPTSLLAAGDHISLCSGQVAPAKVLYLKNEHIIERGEVFDLKNFANLDCHINSKTSSERFEVVSTPIIEDIRVYLAAHNNTSNSTQATLFERQRQYILSVVMKYIIPLLLISSFVVSGIKMTLFHLPTNNCNIHENSSCCTLLNNSIKILVPLQVPSLWYQYFFQIPVMLCLSLFPFYLHALYTILVTIGEARTLAVYRVTSEETARYVALPNTLTMSSQAITMQNDTLQGAKWWKIFLDLMFAKDETSSHRNAGLFLPLGSLTVLCCLDKEGILSWLNPITEKVFFFKPARSGNVDERTELNFPLVIEATDDATRPESHETISWNPMQEDQRVVPETLSLSQESYDPSYVRFDDVNWRNHHTSLKAIGLNIALNLCSCLSDQQSYGKDGFECFGALEFEFDNKIDCNHGQKDESCSHEEILKSIAIKANCLPAGMRMARKGLCDLAEIIGVSQSVKKAYLAQKSFTAYRKPLERFPSGTPKELPPVSGEFGGAVGRKKNWKQCLPNLHGVLYEDLIGDKQLLVYGTGEVIINRCNQVWDGQELHTMTPENRRKALDFYQRSSVAGQCVAFAYSPIISDKPVGNKISVVDLSSEKDIEILTEDLGGEKVLNNLIFLGMTTLQHQAKYTVCHMVDALERACIRFVHFSSDNEVRSRVFAEKMGLETGWNCHISLYPGTSDCPSPDAKRHPNRSVSANSRLTSEVEIQEASKSLYKGDREEQKRPSITLTEFASPRRQSESTATDSLFNVSNTAKLPRGIENIVPHIENFDNVPLLVPLFTDSTPETAGEMINIMKKYGEVVLCVGSADCIRNTVVFPIANVSIAIEPLLQPTLAIPSKDTSLMSEESLPVLAPKQDIEDGFKALEVARNFNCFSCSALLPGENGLPIIMSMISQARHFLFLIRNYFVFLGKCEVTLITVQLLSRIVLLPNPFTPLDVFWLGLVVFPCLSLSLFGSPPDEDLMTWANEKPVPHKDPVLRSTIKDFLKKYSVKFIPSILILVACYFLALESCCMQFTDLLISMEKAENSSLNSTSSIDVNCYPTYLLLISAVSDNQTDIRVSMWDTSEQMKLKLRAIQMTISGFLVVYICVISMGYVHRWKKIPDVLPFTNKFWWIMALTLIALQLALTVITLFGLPKSSGSDANGKEMFDFGPLQIVIWTVLSMWILPCSLFNERWKWREINLWNRWQKRARLNFGTKLGMNSPF